MQLRIVDCGSKRRNSKSYIRKYPKEDAGSTRRMVALKGQYMRNPRLAPWGRKQEGN
jgi:hypothetical protein